MEFKSIIDVIMMIAVFRYVCPYVMNHDLAKTNYMYTYIAAILSLYIIPWMFNQNTPLIKLILSDRSVLIKVFSAWVFVDFVADNAYNKTV